MLETNKTTPDTGVYLESLVRDNCFQWIEVSNYLRRRKEKKTWASVPIVGAGQGEGTGWAGAAGPVFSGTDKLKSL